MRVRLKGINRVSKRLANGERKDYYYAWKGGPPLQGNPGSPEFHASFNAAVEVHKPRPKDVLQTVIDRYLDSPAFLNLAETTKDTYKYQIKRIEAEFSDLPVAALAQRGVRSEFLDWRDRIGAKAPRQADIAFRTLARIISWAFDRELVPANPCLRVGRISTSTRRDKVWTSEQEDAFLESAPQNLQLALLLGLWTGQRQGDLLRLRWSAFDGTHIRLRQRKTAAYVLVPVGRPLRKMLNAAKAKLSHEVDEELLTILVNSNGAPWTTDGFRNSWRKACKNAGVAGVTFHDLRGTAITRLAIAGCTVPEIATITGHTLQDVAAILDRHYLNPDSQLADNAIRKLEKGARRPTKRPTAG